MNPVGFPMSPVLSLVSTDAREIARVLFEGDHDGFVAAQPLLVRALERLDRALEVPGDDAHESGYHGVPVFEHLPRAFASSELVMALDHAAHFVDLGAVGEGFE